MTVNLNWIKLLVNNKQPKLRYFFSISALDEVKQGVFCLEPDLASSRFLLTKTSCKKERGITLGPLEGVRILDLTHMLAGPFGSMILGDLGAEIIKIEPPGGDATRGSSQLGSDSPYFISINRNKKSIVLDLKKEEGVQVLYDLVKNSHVVFENFRPGVTKRLGIDFDTLKQIKPEIICCSISTFGQTGEYSRRPGFDLIVQAMSGAMSLTGEPGGRPLISGLPIGDLGGGIYAAVGILSALYEVSKTGRGKSIEVSLLDGMIGLTTYHAMNYFINGAVPTPVGAGHAFLTVYDTFKTKDRYISIVAHSTAFWEGFCRAIEKPELIDDPRFGDMVSRFQNRAALYEIIEGQLSTRECEYWLKRLLAEDVPSGPVNTLDMALGHELVVNRNMVVEIDDTGRGKSYKVPGNPVKISGYPDGRFAPPPLLGEHTGQVFSEILNYSEEKIASLRSKEVTK